MHLQTLRGNLALAARAAEERMGKLNDPARGLPAYLSGNAEGGETGYSQVSATAFALARWVEAGSANTAAYFRGDPQAHVAHQLGLLEEQLDRVETIAASELLLGAQAIDLRAEVMALTPDDLGKSSKAVYALIRGSGDADAGLSQGPCIARLGVDRNMAVDMEAALRIVREAPGLTEIMTRARADADALLCEGGFSCA